MKKILSFLVVFIIIILIGIVSINLISLKYSSYAKPKINKDLTLTPLSVTTSSTSSPKTETVQLQLTSRTILERAQEIIKQKNPSSVEASRFYAYVATAYFDTLQLTKNPKIAEDAVQEMIRQIYPPTTSSSLYEENSSSELNNHNLTTSSINTSEINLLPTPQEPPLTASDWIKDLLAREKTDGYYSLKWDGKIPAGLGKWKKTTEVPPTNPKAGDWLR